MPHSRIPCGSHRDVSANLAGHRRPANPAGSGARLPYGPRPYRISRAGVAWELGQTNWPPCPAHPVVIRYRRPSLTRWPSGSAPRIVRWSRPSAKRTRTTRKAAGLLGVPRAMITSRDMSPRTSRQQPVRVCAMNRLSITHLLPVRTRNAEGAPPARTGREGRPGMRPSTAPTARGAYCGIFPRQRHGNSAPVRSQSTAWRSTPGDDLTAT